MTQSEITRMRLHNQQIAGTQFTAPGEIVSWLGALQAQDYSGALWAVALRLPNATEQQIEQAIADRTIVLTWPMRGTLHLVAAEDARWMLRLMTPRILAGAASRQKQLDLDEDTFARSFEVFASVLQGGAQRTRLELREALESAGIPADPHRVYHIIWRAAQEGLICCGVRKDKDHSFTLLEEWLPAGKHLTRDQALAEIAGRYFTSHGPATSQDFSRWTGLTAADAKQALASAASNMEEWKFEGRSYWMRPSASIARDRTPEVYLLPGFDEYMLGYKDCGAAFDPEHEARIVSGSNGVFMPTLVIDGQVVGIWKRTLKKGEIVISLSPFTPLSQPEKDAVATAADRYGAFLGRTARLA